MVTKAPWRKSGNPRAPGGQCCTREAITAQIRWLETLRRRDIEAIDALAVLFAAEQKERKRATP
jgi:hypothetical protein